MAFQSVPGAAEAVVVMTCNGETITNTFYGHRDDPYDQGDVDALAEQVDDWVGTEYLPLLSSTLTYVETNVRGLEDINDFFGSADAESGVGGIAIAPFPNSVTIAISRRSGFTGRSARGRVYIPLHTSVVDTNENFMNATAAAEFVSAFGALGAYFTIAGWDNVIVSRYANGVARAAGVVFDITQWAFADLELDTQRRRMSLK